MTAKRDLKKRVRARQARTGERYATARAQVLAGAPAGRVPVIETTDVSATAAAVGLRGRVIVFPSLADHVDVRAMLRRIRDVLAATEDDPTTALLRAFLLEGRPLPAADPPTLQTLTDARLFFRRARAGIGGVSDTGRSLAVSVAGKRGVETVVCLLWNIQLAGLPGNPACVILRPDDALVDALSENWLLLRSIPRSP